MEFNKRKTSCIFFNVLYSEIGCKDGKKGKFHSLCALPTFSMCVMDWGFWILKLAVRLDVSRVWLLLSWPDEGLAVQALPAPSFMAGGALAFGIFRSSLRGRVGFWLSVFPALSFMAGWGFGFRYFPLFPSWPGGGLVFGVSALSFSAGCGYPRWGASRPLLPSGSAAGGRALGGGAERCAHAR